MSKELNKILMPIIRKTYPRMIAEQIVGVQPMTNAQGQIFTILNTWSDWRRTTSLWPRMSVSGKWIFGRINKRGKNVWSPNSMISKVKRKHEFATNKELFASRLRGDV